MVAFTGRASFLAPTISARFGEVAGQVSVAEPGSGDAHGVRVEVDVTTVTTGNRAYDEVIGAVDPFDTARFPIAVYESTRVLWTESGADIEGRLTLRGVTRPVALSASYDVGGGPTGWWSAPAAPSTGRRSGCASTSPASGS